MQHKVLNQILADEAILAQKLRNAHWNIVGDEFYSLHGLFGSHYEQLDEVVDTLAEKIRQCQERPASTYKEFITISRLKESANLGDCDAILKELLKDNESLIATLPTDAAQVDIGNNNYLAGLVEMHSKMAWMLRSSIGE